jgi:hypothetical protein
MTRFLRRLFRRRHRPAVLIVFPPYSLVDAAREVY